MRELVAADGTPLDRIEVTGITAHAFHGVFDHERREGQTFAADVVIHCDTRRAAASDDLADTVNYGTLGSDIHAALQGEPVDLIEALAQRVADVCLSVSGVVAVDVTIHKPQAPLTVPFGNVSLRIRRWATTGPQRADHTTVARAVLSLGSNLGTPEAFLQSAITCLAAAAGIVAVRASGLYDSAPWGGHELAHVDDEPAYVNCVVEVETTLEPEALLNLTQSIEQRHARTREIRWAARTLDIDLVQFVDPAGEPRIIDTPRLTLPHPHAAERAFVLVPWLEVDAAARLAGEPLAAHLERLASSAVATAVQRREQPSFVVPGV